jgi:uncharacterized protein (TIGR03435 family)
MTRRTAIAVAAVAIAIAWPATGQAPPTFEVASVKLVPPPLPTGGGAWVVTHGRFRAETCYVRGMIAWAYKVMPSQVNGRPDWLDREPYYIDARAGDPEAPPEQIRLMSQTLLADRFRLAVHRETRQGQVYTLTVGKNGSKLQDAKNGTKNWINWTGPGKVTFEENQGLAGLVNIASAILGAPVIDETGLKGSYNFSLEFSDPRDPRPRQSDSPPVLEDAVQVQLGLHLQATKGPVDALVIDHMERPSAN